MDGIFLLTMTILVHEDTALQLPGIKNTQHLSDMVSTPRRWYQENVFEWHGISPTWLAYHYQPNYLCSGGS